MRIVHVVGVISPDGSYGGPATVALNQTRALIEAGFSVTLAAGARGFGASLPETFNGIPVRLFRARALGSGSSFASMVAPGLNAWLRDRLRSDIDVLHIHLARDLITLPAAVQGVYAGKRLVVQPHGMITQTTNPLATPLDALATRRVLQYAEKVFHLTIEEGRQLELVAKAPLPLTQLNNGMLGSPEWAGTGSSGLEVLFLARLHARKRPLTFIEIAKRIHVSYPEVAFRLVGPDGGQGREVEEAILSSGIGRQLEWEGALNPGDVASRFQETSIYVLPSENEPFGMTVLEAMAQGKPVVVTDSCALSAMITEARAGIVAGHDVDSLSNAVMTLLSDADLRAKYGANARELAISKFGMAPVVSALRKAYAK